jgi:hypothetical protein
MREIQEVVLQQLRQRCGFVPEFFFLSSRHIPKEEQKRNHSMLIKTGIRRVLYREVG